MTRFSSHSRTSLRAEVSFSLTWPLAFAKPFMTVRNLRSQGKFENINFATDSYFIDQYFAKAISTYVPFYSLNLRRLARVELSFELEFFWNETKKSKKTFSIWRTWIISICIRLWWKRSLKVNSLLRFNWMITEEFFSGQSTKHILMRSRKTRIKYLQFNGF